MHQESTSYLFFFVSSPSKVHLYVHYLYLGCSGGQNLPTSIQPSDVPVQRACRPKLTTPCLPIGCYIFYFPPTFSSGSAPVYFTEEDSEEDSDFNLWIQTMILKLMMTTYSGERWRSTQREDVSTGNRGKARMSRGVVAADHGICPVMMSYNTTAWFKFQKKPA
jgi:hypothetical protein